MKKAALSFLLIFFLTASFLGLSVQSISAESLGSAEIKCNPKDVSNERNPRPAQCNICTTAELLTPCCANSFKVFDKITYPKTGPKTIKDNWSGNVTIDPTQVKIPFVGKRNEEGIQWWEISKASENKYLADYLEGTNEYYRNYGNQTTITNYQGVLRKLTPFEYQNQLKRNLVLRVGNGEENQIHDYKIRYIGRLCWDTPFWMDAGRFVANWFIDKTVNNPLNKIVIAIKRGWAKFLGREEEINEKPTFQLSLPDVGHFCVYESLQEGAAGWIITKVNNFLGNLPDIGELKVKLEEFSRKTPGLVHVRSLDGEEAFLSEIVPPPDPSEEKYRDNPSQYAKDFLRWKKRDGGKWYQLWQATPMLSREDTQGEIDPYLAKEHKDDSFEVEEEAKVEAVPHLARLYEGSQIIHQILNPKDEEIEMFKSEEIAKTTPPYTCLVEDYFLADESGDGLCCEKITTELTAWEEFENEYYDECVLTASPSASCKDKGEKEVSRAFGVNLNHPYLDEIWSYTTYDKSAGFFNIFRPYGVPAFEDIAAADIISYSYNPKGLKQTGEVSPRQGLFFFPHLGGVQKAKEYVVNEALWPYKKD